MSECGRSCQKCIWPRSSSVQCLLLGKKKSERSSDSQIALLAVPVLFVIRDVLRRAPASGRVCGVANGATVAVANGESLSDGRCSDEMIGSQKKRCQSRTGRARFTDLTSDERRQPLHAVQRVCSP